MSTTNITSNDNFKQHVIWSGSTQLSIRLLTLGTRQHFFMSYSDIETKIEFCQPHFPNNNKSASLLPPLVFVDPITFSGILSGESQLTNNPYLVTPMYSLHRDTIIVNN